MSCKYYYKDLVFNNELELDDFLFETLPLETELGDAVFRLSSAQLAVLPRIRKINDESFELRKTLREKLKSKELIYSPDGDVTFGEPPYIGVNKFLSGLENRFGHLLFPEFREEAYWEQEFELWKKGEFNDVEKEEIFGSKDAKTSPITDRADCEKYRDQIKNRWKQQSLCGTAIHEVMEACFSYSNTYKGANVKRMTIELLIATATNKLRASGNYKYVNDEIIKLLCNYAIELSSLLEQTYGEDLLYYPEIMVSDDTVQNDGKSVKLAGMIDLLVIDRNGNTHIIDYKTSTHNYAEYSKAKILSYEYLLATYQRLLERRGLSNYTGTMHVCPITINGFEKVRDNYIFKSVDTLPSLIQINNNPVLNLWENINEFLPSSFMLSLSTTQALSTVDDMMKEWFPEYESGHKITRDEVIKLLKDHNALEKDENGFYKYMINGKEEKRSTETELVDLVTKYYSEMPNQRVRLTSNIKTAMQLAIKNLSIEGVGFPSARNVRTGNGSAYNLKEYLSKYCNGAWEMIDNALLNELGLLVFKTVSGVEPPLVEIVRITGSLLTSKRTMDVEGQEKRSILTQKYESDISLKSRSDSLMLDAITGNIELMETMLILNLINGLDNCTIGQIMIANPNFGEMLKPSNEELAYCWRELNGFNSVKTNKFADGTIKLAKMHEVVRSELRQLLYESSVSVNKGKYANITLLNTETCKSMLDWNVDTSNAEKIKRLEELDKQVMNIINNSHGNANLMSTYDKSIKTKELLLHEDILFAIAELRGINFRQQYKDHDAWIEHLNVFKHGLTGLNLDNPGNMSAETLNLVTNLLNEAYQNTAEEMTRQKNKIDQVANKIKKEYDLTYVKERLAFNQVDMYKDMIEVTNDGDLVFKNPDDLIGAKKEFLEFALDVINRNRYPKMSEKEREEKRKNNDRAYYRVPITKGHTDTKVSVDGLNEFAKSKLKMLDPRRIAKNVKNYIYQLFTGVDEKDYKNSEIFFEMTNDFDRGESDNRLQIIQEMGISNIEHNIENILYKHIYAYSLKLNVDKVFPMIKAAYVHITTQGTLQNNKFLADTDYLKKYVTNKILNKAINDPKLRPLINTVSLLRTLASYSILMFSPIQLLYQPLMGLWVDISLMIRKPDGKESFTFDHFKKASKIVWSDFFHYSDDPTLCSLLNEFYRLNDMDINCLAERVNNCRKGVWDFWGYAMKFASRPDYYNRLTIFLCLMMGDGCLEAHSIKDGKLYYDWTKDKRFDVFAKGDKSNPKYNEQRSLYYAFAKLLEAEGTKNADGTDFILNMNKPMALPKAYTTKQSEGHKSTADDIYGYYSSEKKSMVNSMWMGALWMQMKTYWSAKKNQWLGAGGVKMKGSWEQLEINGEKQFYKVKDGEVQWNDAYTTEDTGVPVTLWKGQWQEGMILTVAQLVLRMYDHGWNKNAWDEMWNIDDPFLRTVYRSNFKKLGYDVGMFTLSGLMMSLLINPWVHLIELDNKDNEDFLDALKVSAIQIAAHSLRNSFLDFNFLGSVLSPMITWLPLAFSWASKEGTTVVKCMLGDEDVYEALVKSTSATRYYSPMFDVIEPDFFKIDKKDNNKKK